MPLLTPNNETKMRMLCLNLSLSLLLHGFLAAFLFLLPKGAALPKEAMEEATVVQWVDLEAGEGKANLTSVAVAPFSPPERHSVVFRETSMKREAVHEKRQQERFPKEEQPTEPADGPIDTGEKALPRDHPDPPIPSHNEEGEAAQKGSTEFSKEVSIPESIGGDEEGTVGLHGAPSDGRDRSGENHPFPSDAGEGEHRPGLSKEALWSAYLAQLKEKVEAVRAYPAQALRIGLEGTVAVRLILAGDGRIESVGLAEASPFALLNRSAINAIRALPPLPPLPPGMGERLEVVIPLVYRLESSVRR